MSKLTKPAKVGAATFSIGVDERLVINAAQRQHDWHNEDGSTTPKGEKMPDNVEAWKRLYGLAEDQMLHDKERISSLKQRINRLEHRPEWITTAPENCGEYLTYRCGEHEIVYYDSGEDTWHNADGGELLDIGGKILGVHGYWPLPSPPKGE